MIRWASRHLKAATVRFRARKAREVHVGRSLTMLLQLRPELEGVYVHLESLLAAPGLERNGERFESAGGSPAHLDRWREADGPARRVDSEELEPRLPDLGLPLSLDHPFGLDAIRIRGQAPVDP